MRAVSTAVALLVLSVAACGEVDTTPPRLVSTAPADGAIDVPLAPTVLAVLDEALDPASVSAGALSLRAGDVPVPGTVSVAGDTVVFIPDVPLAPRTAYAATLAGTVADLAGNPLGAEASWSFATRDAQPPQVVAVYPEDGAVEIPVSTALTVEFSTSMDPLTISPDTISLTHDGIPVAGTVSYSGVLATFTPLVDLAGDAAYVATVGTGARDPLGTPLAAAVTWGFGTGPGRPW